MSGLTLTTCEITPSCTGTGINDIPSLLGDHHHVVLPPASRKDVLVVFFGGSDSVPSVYGSVSAEAASKGYGVVDLRYHDSPLVGTACGNQDACFASFRGMNLFGDGVTVPNVQGSPYHWDGSITGPDSMINRLVNVVDLLATADSWWAQFLTDTASSPYASAHHPHVLPSWSQIVFSGHSQGGGNAALIGVELLAARRIIMFGSPDDHTGTGNPSTNPGTSATWITSTSLTPMQLSRFWGIRDTQEGAYSECTSYSWHNLGQPGSTACTIGDEATHSWEVFVGQGDGAANGAHFLVTTDQTSETALYAHDSSSLDDNSVDGSASKPFSTKRTTAWDYLFTANQTD